ncbi:hypothetical protein G6L37_06070 [Agrobacterium rubi]|nr:hypothetical protein [Agrobacterium rubi]NTF24927.1 hypothetical protein [Agrobacterium rubi]
MHDIYGNLLPPSVWHGSLAGHLPDTVLPASTVGEWWNVIDHDFYLDPPEAEDVDHRAEIDFEIRTAYANAVYEAFIQSNNPELRAIAESMGLHGLGDEIGIIFVSGDQSYVERYGTVLEVDPRSEGFLAALPDENLVEDRLSWLLVFKAGSPFPAMSGSLLRP